MLYSAKQYKHQQDDKKQIQLYNNEVMSIMFGNCGLTNWLQKLITIKCYA